jgi:type IV/VI secretion system ImpK/VasF family protein
MNKPFARIVYKVLAEALDVKERLDRGESPNIEAVRQQFIPLIRSEGEGRRLSDYVGDGVFLGARYALACWVDELFINSCGPTWGREWQEQILEYELFHTNEAAEMFWQQADIVLRRPNSPRASIAPGADAVETFALCVVLGFRGKYRDNPSKVREYLEEMRPQLTRPISWQSPRDLGVQTNVAPLLGRETLRRVVGIYGGLTLVIAIVLLVLYRF